MGLLLKIGHMSPLQPNYKFHKHPTSEPHLLCKEKMLKVPNTDLIQQNEDCIRGWTWQMKKGCSSVVKSILYLSHENNELNQYYSLNNYSIFFSPIDINK
jgi:hypothetical protein